MSQEPAGSEVAAASPTASAILAQPIDPVAVSSIIGLVLDSLALATFIVDREGGLIHANEPAKALTTDGEQFRQEAGRLEATNAAVQPLLGRLIATTIDKWHPGALAIPRTAGKRPLLAVAMPIAKPIDSHRNGAALLLIDDPLRERLVPRDLLRDLFGLTPAEAELALGLSRGRQLASVARDRGVQVTTARSQLRALLAKTGCGRQADLPRLLSGLTVLKYAIDGGQAKLMQKS